MTPVSALEGSTGPPATKLSTHRASSPAHGPGADPSHRPKTPGRPDRPRTLAPPGPLTLDRADASDRKAVPGATQANELDQGRHTAYRHRAAAYTMLPTPEWENALADRERHIDLFPSYDPETD